MVSAGLAPTGRPDRSCCRVCRWSPVLPSGARADSVRQPCWPLRSVSVGRQYGLPRCATGRQPGRCAVRSRPAAPWRAAAQLLGALVQTGRHDDTTCPKAGSEKACWHLVVQPRRVAPQPTRVAPRRRRLPRPALLAPLPGRMMASTCWIREETPPSGRPVAVRSIACLAGVPGGPAAASPAAVRSMALTA